MKRLPKVQSRALFQTCSKQSLVKLWDFLNLLFELIVMDFCDYEHLKLGIDLGTTTLKLVVTGVRNDSYDIECLYQTCGKAPEYLSGIPSDFKEQNVNEIINVLSNLTRDIPENLLKLISAICVSTQMHGIVFWNNSLDSDPKLITWEDKRCDDNFLEKTFSKISSSSNKGKSGYGWATYTYLVAQNDKRVSCSSRIGTLGDYLVYNLLGASGRVAMCHANAQSWGTYDLLSKNWDKNFVEQLLNEFNVQDISVIPSICDAGTVLGKVAHESSFASRLFGRHAAETERWDVFVAIDDLSASVFPLQTDGAIVINLGTSLQLSYLVSEETLPLCDNSMNSFFEVRPFLKHGYLIVWASLNGGNTLSCLLQSWLGWYNEMEQVFGKAGSDTENDTFKNNELLEQLFLHVDNIVEDMCKEGLPTRDMLQCYPWWNGERCCPNLTGSFTNIVSSGKCLNISLADQAFSLLWGLCVSI